MTKTVRGHIGHGVAFSGPELFKICRNLTCPVCNVRVSTASGLTCLFDFMHFPSHGFLRNLAYVSIFSIAKSTDYLHPEVLILPVALHLNSLGGLDEAAQPAEDTSLCPAGH